MCRTLIYLISFILVTGPVLTSAAKAADPDLVGYWKLDDESGTTAEDASGNGNDGDVNGPFWTLGVIEGALYFDGDDDYVDLGSLDVLPDGQPGLSISAWFKADSFNNSRDNRILSKTTSPSGDSHYWMLSTFESGNQTVLRFRLKTDEETETLVADQGGIQTGQWVHAVGTYDGSVMRLYEDNVEVGVLPKSGDVSRIVPFLKPGAGVVTSRADVHYVVTEFGVAQLFGKNLRERAEALISIAAPQFRDELLHAAKERKLLT